MAAESVTATTEIRDGRTVVTVTGTREAAVVVESDSGERVYLPPEPSTGDPDADRANDDSPYEGITEDPYEGITEDPYEGIPADSPYEGMTEQSPYGSSAADPTRLGVTPTDAGFRVVHPEPVTDLRLLR